MNGREPRVLKIAVMVASVAVALGYAISQRPTFGVPLARASQNKNPVQPTERNTALGLARTCEWPQRELWVSRSRPWSPRRKRNTSQRPD